MGTVIVRPSAKSTLRVSSVTRAATGSGRISGLAKVLIPTLQQNLSVFLDVSADHIQLVRREAPILCQLDNRVEPKLRFAVVAGVSYPIPMNSTGTVHLMPEAFFDYGLTNMVKGLDWSVSAFRLGASL